MYISFIPLLSDETLEVVKQGDTLILNGEVFDFSPLNDGEILPHGAVDSPWFLGQVERVDGELILTLRLPHGPNAPESQTFPDPLVNVPDGLVALPQGVTNED